MAKVHKVTGHKIEPIEGSSWFQVSNPDGTCFSKTVSEEEARRSIWVKHFKSDKGMYVLESDFIEVGELNE